MTHTSAFTVALFDLDGTLLDTIPDLADAVNGMRRDMGMEPLRQDLIATYVGKGTPHLVARSLSDAPPLAGASAAARAREGLRLFEHHYRQVNGARATLYPDVREGLSAFADMGIRRAIVTNKPTEFTHSLLKRAGLADFFEHVVCGDTCARKKPDPMPMLHACALMGADPARVLAIGDSINDAEAARAAGITVLAVPYGYNEGRDVRTLPVDAIVATIKEAALWAARHRPEPKPIPEHS